MRGITQKAYDQVLTDVQFEKLSTFLYDNYGLKMPPSKKLMMEGRLKRRLVNCNIDNFEQYVDYVFSTVGRRDELIHMVDSLTTNKTDFFRENHHFKYLAQVVCPKLVSSKKLTVWSAGCSSG